MYNIWFDLIMFSFIVFCYGGGGVTLFSFPHIVRWFTWCGPNAHRWICISNQVSTNLVSPKKRKKKKKKRKKTQPTHTDISILPALDWYPLYQVSNTCGRDIHYEVEAMFSCAISDDPFCKSCSQEKSENQRVIKNIYKL